MNTIKLVFTKSKKKLPIGSLLIRWWTKKPYSHVARALTMCTWGAGYYQASEGKVNYEHEDVFNTKHKIIREYNIPITKEIKDSVEKMCWQDAGKKYGYLQNLGILLIDLKITKHNPWKQGRNCSELIYIKVLKPMFPELNYNPDTIKPHEIEEILIKKGFKHVK